MSTILSMAPIATNTTDHSDSEPTEIILPDFFSDCHYPLRSNPHCDSVARASEQWSLNYVHLAGPELTKFMGLHAGEFASGIYPDADAFHLQVVVDSMNWSWTIDDWLDEFDVNETLGMRECCISALRDPINFQTEKSGAKMCKSYVDLFYHAHIL